MTSCIGQENLMIVGIVELGERNTETSRIWRELNIWEVCFVAVGPSHSVNEDCRNDIDVRFSPAILQQAL